jgi:RNA polymerase sigma-70 factor (ECF subfamily)
MESGEIVELWARARAAWPGLEVDVESFSRLLDAQSAPANAEDLYLACACSIECSGAIDAFLRRHEPDIEAALSKMSLSSATRDDVKQTVLEKLFVTSSDRRKRIDSYRGRGSLQGWVRAVAVRCALDQLRREGHGPAPVDDLLLETLAVSEDDPEIRLLQGQYRDQVRDAFVAAFARVTVRQRNLLRQHYVRGISVEHIGRQHGVHRVTAFRWLMSARADVLAAAKEALSERLGGTEVTDSFLRLLRSQLEVSLGTLLPPAA